MKISRMVSGIGLLTASAWLGPALSNLLGVSEVFGYVSVSALMAFCGGILFTLGLYGKGKGVTV